MGWAGPRWGRRPPCLRGRGCSWMRRSLAASPIPSPASPSPAPAGLLFPRSPSAASSCLGRRRGSFWGSGETSPAAAAGHAGAPRRPRPARTTPRAAAPGASPSSGSGAPGTLRPLGTAAVPRGEQVHSRGRVPAVPPVPVRGPRGTGRGTGRWLLLRGRARRGCAGSEAPALAGAVIAPRAAGLLLPARVPAELPGSLQAHPAVPRCGSRRPTRTGPWWVTAEARPSKPATVQGAV